MEQLRVMTYNIQSGKNLEGVLDIRFAAEVIASQEPDLCALNEVRDHTLDIGPERQTQQLGEAVGMHHVFAKAIDVLGGGYGIGLLSRYPILSAETVCIPALPLVERNRRYEPRVLLRCRVDVNGKPLCVYVTHYGLSPGEQRLAVETTVLSLRSETLPVLFMGDLNMPPDDPLLAPLYATLCDVSQGRDEPLTFPSDKPKSKIDYIFVSEGLHAARVWAQDTQHSDHRPLLADIAWG